MKVVRVIALIALIGIPSSSFAWSRGGAVGVRPGFANRAVVVGPGFANRAVFVSRGFPGRVAFVRPGFPARFVAPAFVGGLASGIVLNPLFLPRSFYFPGPLVYDYPQSSVFASGYYPPSYSYEVASPPPASSPPDAYGRGYSEGYAQGYEEALKERDKERHEEGRKRGYEEGYEAGKEAQNP